MRIAAALVAALALAACASVAPAAHHRHWPHPQIRHDLRVGIAWQRSMTWKYQDAAYVARTRTTYAEKHTRSVEYLRWIAHRWNFRRIRAKAYYLAHVLPYTNDWATAVRVVQRTWPGTSAWMLSCSAHEGGHGGFVMNHQGSGAGGWMQYMAGTFAAHFAGAMALARQEHRPFPPLGSRAWTTPLGQAFAAGWGYSHNRSAWTGDPYC